MRDGKVKTKDDFSNLNFIIIPVPFVRLRALLLRPLLPHLAVVVVNMMNRDNFLGITLATEAEQRALQEETESGLGEKGFIFLG